MKLSMWIINDGLREYQPISLIKNGAQTIKNVRYFSENCDFDLDFVYVGYSKDFFGSDSHDVICVSGSDILLLKTDDMFDVFNKILRIFEKYNFWELTLIEHIDSGASLRELLDLSKDVFQYPLVITDASHQVLAVNYPDNFSNSEYDKYQDAKVDLPLDVLTMMNAELVQNIQEKSSYVDQTKLFSHPCIIKNLYRKDELVGWFVIFDLREKNFERLMQISNAFGRLIEHWFRSNEENSKLTSQADLFLDILTGKVSDRSRIISRLQGIGWLEEDEKLVIKVCMNNANDPILYTLRRVLPQAFSGCYVISYMQSLVLFLNLRLFNKNNLDQLLTDVLNRSQTYCGVSYKFTNMLKLQNYYHQAELAAIYGENKPGTINYCEDYAMDYLKDIIQDNLSTDIRHPALKILKGYDEAHNTEYLTTLKEYLENERDQRKTAKLLCVHRNTLVYRVNRIEEILGIDLNDTKIRTHLWMSYFISDTKRVIG